MHLPSLLYILPLAYAAILVSYDAASGDDPSSLGLLNLQGWHRADWPSGKGMNNSLYFTTATDPDGTPAAHVHKAAHFTRAEYHTLKDKTARNLVYYMGYHVRFDNVDHQTIIWQWKNYNNETVDTDNIPAALVFRKDVSGPDAHTIHFGVNPDPQNPGEDGNSVWAKELVMGKDYRFGIVIDTSTNGFIQLYFNGRPATLTDLSTGEHTQKLPGNYWPGPTSDPKFGLYGGNNYKVCDSYIYGVVIGTQLSDIAQVAGIQS